MFNIFATRRPLKIGDILIPGITPEFGGPTDINGNLCHTAVQIVRMATKEEYIQQFKEIGINQITWPNDFYYEVRAD